MRPSVPVLREKRSTVPIGADWPRALLALARSRLQWFAWLMCSLQVVGLLLLPFLGREELPDSVGGKVRVLRLVGLVLVAGLALALRSEGLTHRNAIKLGLAVAVLLCLLLNLEAQLSHVVLYDAFRSLTWACVVMVLYPLMIPSPVRYTLITSVLAALTAPASLLFMELLGAPSPEPMDFLRVSANPFACIIIAVMGSKAVHEVERKLDEARQMGSYELESQLAQGGMGAVWRARHRMLSRPAAIKLIRADALQGSASDTELTFKRFEREAQSTASLRSPHTVDLYDFGRTDDGSLYIVMELLDGLDLHRLLSRYGPMAPERVAHMLLQVAHSLKEAHLAGLTHRDIKPANVFVCRYGAELDHVKVLDFGLASLKPAPGGGDARLTKADSVLGTPGFMAPEMMEDGTAVDRRSDLYSLGCVAYWMLAGRSVFPEESVVGAMIAHTFERPPPFSAIEAIEVPPALEEVVQWCLEKQPAKRPQTAQELSERLLSLGLAETWTPDRARAWWDEHLPPSSS